MNLLRSLAESKRLRIRERADTERVIIGRDGEIYQPTKDQLAVVFMPGKWTPRRWNAGRDACKALGMICAQDGDSEGTLLFNPADEAQTEAAIKLAHIRRRHPVSPERRAFLTEQLRKARQNRSIVD